MVADDSEPGVAIQREATGIMVFSPTCHVLYANQAAQGFLQQLRGQESNPVAKSTLPVSILELLHEMLASLEKSMTIPCQRSLQTKRRAGALSPLLLQAFGLPDCLGSNRPRVVITMHGTHSFETRSPEASPLT